MKKRILAILLFLIMISTIMPVTPILSLNAPNYGESSGQDGVYNSNWANWSQGSSKYKKMHDAGCHAVAQAKLMMEAGYITDSSFNPDRYYEWLCRTPHNNNYYLWGGSQSFFPGDCIKKYTSGSIIAGTPYDYTTVSQVYTLLEDYYVIIEYNNHFNYVMREMSLSSSDHTVYISDSGSDTKEGKIKPLSSYHLTPQKVLVYAISNPPAPKPLPDCINIEDVTKSTELKSDSVIIRGKLNYNSYSAGVVTEVGIDIGTSSSNVLYLAKDTSSSGWGNGQEFFYNLGNKGVNISPGKTYYYRFYAKNSSGDVYHSGIKSFTVPNGSTQSLQSCVYATNTTKDSEITSSSVILRGQLHYNSYSAGKVTEFGIDVGTSQYNVSYLSHDASSSGFSDGQNFNYNIKNKGFNFTPGKTYYFRFYAKNSSGDVYHSDITAFTVPDSGHSLTISEVSVSNETKESEITSSGVIIRGKLHISNYSGKVVEVGIDCGTTADNVSYLSCDKKDAGWSNGQNYYYNLGNKGFSMTAGNRYFYRFYLKTASGDVFHSQTYSFVYPGHTHVYSERYESAHPHKVYMKCSCGAYYYTGDNKYSLVYHSAKEPTCTEYGWASYYTCPGCSYTTYQTINATGHSLVHIDAYPATCYDYGYDAFDYCTKCDYSTYHETEPLGHNLIHYNKKDATCTELGWEAYDECDRCGYSSFVEIHETGHSFDSGTIIDEPTLTSDGTLKHVCIVCGFEKNEVIPKLCIESVTLSSLPDKTRYYTEEEFDSTGLSLRVNYSDGTEDIITDGFSFSGFSSDQAGEKTVCVNYYEYSFNFTVSVVERPIDEVPVPRTDCEIYASGSDVTVYWDPIPRAEFYTISIKDPDGNMLINEETTYDLYYSLISICTNGVYEVSLIAGNSNSLSNPGKCTFSVETEKLPESLPEIGEVDLARKSWLVGFWGPEFYFHVDNYDSVAITYYVLDPSGEYLYFRKPLRDTVGPHWFSEDVFPDGEYMIQVIAENRLGLTQKNFYFTSRNNTYTLHDASVPHFHEYTDEDFEPTCETSGFIKHVCQCGDSYLTDVSSSHGHEYGNWGIESTPTCVDEGSEARYCSICGGKEEKAISSLGHKFGKSVIDVQPTLTSPGTRSKHCDRCDAVTDEETVLYKIGDSDGDGSVTASDVVAIKSYLADGTDRSYICLVNADIDGDGSFTARDVDRMKTLLAS